MTRKVTNGQNTVCSWHKVILPLLVTLTVTLATAAPFYAQNPIDQKLERAVAALRNIRQGAFTTEAQQEAKSKEIDEAWEVIRQAGARGTARLKQELERVERSREKDDFFKLNASALLWGIGQFDEAPAIAAIWNSTPLEAQYKYVFYTAIDAARTGDARALPMLEAVLRDNKGHVFLWQHSLDVKWPLTHEFVWGAFGPKALPRLAEIISTSKNEIEVASAISLLAQSHYLPALPRLRELARAGTGDARLFAIRALGVYGHPQDYDFLVAGLRSGDPKELFSYSYALYEYEDLRAVPHLIPLLGAADKAVRQETFAALTHLLTSESVDALHRHAQTTKERDEKETIEEHLNSELREYNLSLNQYLKKSPAGRAEAVAAILRRREAEKYQLGTGEKGMTRSEFVTAVKRWKEEHRLSRVGGERVMPKHILVAATAADIELLLEVKAALYLRLSDEALYEARRMDEVVKRLGRSRYRKQAGITEKVEAL